MNVNDTGCRPILINVWKDNEYCHVVPIADPIYGHLYDAYNPHYSDRYQFGNKGCYYYMEYIANTETTMIPTQTT